MFTRISFLVDVALHGAVHGPDDCGPVFGVCAAMATSRKLPLSLLSVLYRPLPSSLTFMALQMIMETMERMGKDLMMARWLTAALVFFTSFCKSGHISTIHWPTENIRTVLERGETGLSSGSKIGVFHCPKGTES